MNGAAGGLMLGGEVAQSYLVISRQTGRFIVVIDRHSCMLVHSKKEQLRMGVASVPLNSSQPTKRSTRWTTCAQNDALNTRR